MARRAHLAELHIPSLPASSAHQRTLATPGARWLVLAR